MSRTGWFRQLLMIFHEIEMDNDLPDVQLVPKQGGVTDENLDTEPEEIVKLRCEFQSRLIVANLRTEAVRAGMIDLDGLKLIDVSTVQLGNDDRVIGGRKLVDDLRRTKPWL